MIILVTGVAGFIGFHLTKKLIESETPVIGIDNLNNYYDPELKHARLNILKNISSNTPDKFKFIKTDLKNRQAIDNIFNAHEITHVVNLAAQAGVRYSITNPDSYIESNLVGFFNIIENCKLHNIKHFLYASSSSVYGGNTKTPFSENDSVDHPVSLYGATKKCNELIAHTYSHLYKLPTTGLRFFTVYGPWGRPDMALFLFTKAILEDKPIKVFNKGNMVRDFTYIDDIIEGLIFLINKPAKSNLNFNKSNPDSSSSWCPYRIFNLGNSNPIPLMDFIKEIEKSLGKTANKEYLPLQQGDVPATFSSPDLLNEWINFQPNTSVQEGISEFVKWYKDFYKPIS